jgi:SAM-dependent methyltransferase
VSAFGAYARYYDLLYRDKNYAEEVDYVIRLVQDHTTGAATILELGCGTGLHACLMADRGYRVRGIDMSDGMLNAAQERRSALPVELQERIAFDPGDVRSYRHADRVDAVVSLFHVFSYQTSNEDLSAAFGTAAAHLKPGGVLICDFWYGPAVLAQRPETRVKRLQDDAIDVVRIAEPVLHHETNVVDVRYDIQIIERQTSVMQAVRETHRMRYFFLPELEFVARCHGLQLTRSYRWLTRDPAADDAWSVVAVFVKH